MSLFTKTLLTAVLAAFALGEIAPAAQAASAPAAVTASCAKRHGKRRKRGGKKAEQPAKAPKSFI
jgi:hypothetical protein